MFLTYLIALMVALLVCGIAYMLLYPHFSEKLFQFTDIIIETIARTGYDKAGELKLFWVLLTLGCCLLLLTCVIAHAASKKREDRAESRLPIYSLITLFPLLTNILLYGKINILLTLGFLYVCIILLIKDHRKLSVGEELALPVLLYYALFSLLTCLFYFTDRLQVSSLMIYSAVAILTGLFHLCKADTIRKGMLYLQCVIPFLLVVYLVDSYLYRGSLIHVRYAPFYYVFFLVLIAGFLFHAIRHAVLTVGSAKPDSQLICMTTPILVFIYNSFSACPLYAQPDQHHHGEQLIPWQQIVSLGQSAYETYTPVSGLFPMVNGFIQNVLMRGTVSDYSPAISITMVLFCILTMFLVVQHVGSSYALCFAVFFALPSYNRQYMVLPVLLLLFLPKLMEKEILWLLTWVYACFLAGLYYPLYGAAVLLGTLPLGLHILAKLRSKMDWSDQHKKTLPFTRFIASFVPILLCVPLLSRILNHTLTYSSQTQMADGIALFGQTPPDFFMPYLALKHAGLRQWIYLTYRFLLPMLAVWIFVLLLFLIIREHKQLVYVCLAGMITLCISYTYTLVRADVNMILSRTAPILIAVCGMFLPVMLLSYQRHSLKRISPYLFMLLLGISFSTPSMIYQKVSHMKFPDMWIYPNGESTLVMDDTLKLYHHYEVPELFIKMEEIDLADKSMLGNGFMVADQTGYLQHYETVMNKCESALKQHATSENIPKLSYLGFDGQGFYYYLNARACSTGFIQAGKGYEAQQEILTNVKAERPVIFLIEPWCNYFVYTWMMENNYVYCESDQAFYPFELYCLVYDTNYSSASIGMEPETVLGNPSLMANGMIAGDDYRTSCPATDFGLVPSSFGASYETLRPLFIHEADFSEFANNTPVPGIKHDFLYLKWDTDGLNKLFSICQSPSGYQKDYPLTLTLQFSCDDKEYSGAKVTCLLTNQNLLLPLGMNADWLLSQNSDLKISITNIDGETLYNASMEDFVKEYMLQASYLKLAQNR